jgi:hypothetical protein
LNVGATLYAIASAGLSLAVSNPENSLRVYPAQKLTPKLARAIKDHKEEIVRIVREDEEMRRTGIVQSERQVFEQARELFGPSRPFDPDEQPPSKHELWVNPDKERFFYPHRYPDGGGAA